MNLYLKVKNLKSGQEENMSSEVQRWELLVVQELPLLAEENYRLKHASWGRLISRLNLC